MRIEEALQKLDTIHAASERVGTYHGLRAAPIAATGLLGFAAAMVQPAWVATASDSLLAYLTLWSGAAGIALSIILVGMLLRYHSDPTARCRRLTLEVLTRLAPCLLVGAGLLVFIYASAPEACWMLPGLWSLTLGLGVCAASGILPRSLRQMGLWYIGCGFVVLLVAQEGFALHPLAMAVPFGCGQLLTAWLIHTHEAGN